MSKLQIKLFISGKTDRSDIAEANLRNILTKFGTDNFELDIVDVVENPQSAEDDFILVTPTLIKYSPLPIRRIIGDLSDQRALLRGLDI